MKILRHIILGVFLAGAIGLTVASRMSKKEEEPQPKPQTDFSVVSAPDQTEPMEHEHFIKKEYVAKELSGTNIALDGKMDSSTHNSSYTAMKANDGDTAGSSYWEGESNVYPSTLTVDAGKDVNVHAIRACLCPDAIWGERRQTFSVEISQDGQTFTELIPMTEYTFSPEEGNETTIEFTPVSCRYIQLTFTANTGANAGQIAEFEVYAE